MEADKILKLISKTIELTDYRLIKTCPPFEIPKKVLILLPKYIGDSFLLIPTIKNLRYNFGEKTKIDIAGNVFTKNLLEHLPYYDNFYNENKVSTNKLNFLKKKNYDTVFIFNFSLLWGISCFQAQIKQRISFSLERTGIDNFPFINGLITHFIDYTAINDKKHQKDVYLNTLNKLGLKIFNEEPELYTTKSDATKAKALINNISLPKILIHVASGSKGKDWPIENWCEIVKYLNKNHNCSIISCGTNSEKALYDYIKLKTGVEIHNLCGQTSIRETFELYKHMDLLITIDSAPAHLASFAGCKNLIVLYGPTNEAQWKPLSSSSNVHQVFLDLKCRPCITRLCSHKNCLTKLTPKMVIEKINEISL